MKRRKLAPRRPVLRILALSAAAPRGVLAWGGLNYPCALGRSGCAARKREGDGATPMGQWRLLRVLFRPDRGLRPPTALPVRAIAADDGWCDAPADRNYNRPVRHPYPASAERLWREDALYDLVVVLDCNARPRVRGRGSAIFMHVARHGYAPTEGCIALARGHLLALLARLVPGSSVAIGRAPKKSARSFRFGR